MLTGFDWLRRTRSGAELLATLRCFEAVPELLTTDKTQLGAPHSALGGPCQRCWIYPRQSSLQSAISDNAAYDVLNADEISDYCYFCALVWASARRLGPLSRKSIVIWGFANRLPKQLQSGRGFQDSRIMGSYAPDDNRFLLMMHRLQLKPWLQELIIYHGPDLKGLIQIFPTVGSGDETGMGDILCRAISHEGNFAMDRLRVQFYSDGYQIMRLQSRDQAGMLNFDAAEFLNLLEMATIFRNVLQPEEQEMLNELLTIVDVSEQQFYWGRFLGYLSQEAKDMLNAWRIRQWPKEQVKLLYELRDHVVFSESD